MGGVDIQQPHNEVRVERRLESTVLRVQDTTTLNYIGLCLDPLCHSALRIIPLAEPDRANLRSCNLTCVCRQPAGRAALASLARCFRSGRSPRRCSRVRARDKDYCANNGQGAKR